MWERHSTSSNIEHQSTASGILTRPWSTASTDLKACRGTWHINSKQSQKAWNLTEATCSKQLRSAQVKGWEPQGLDSRYALLQIKQCWFTSLAFAAQMGPIPMSGAGLMDMIREPKRRLSISNPQLVGMNRNPTVRTSKPKGRGIP